MRSDTRRNNLWITILLYVIFLLLMVVMIYNREVYSQSKHIDYVDIAAIDSMSVQYATPSKLRARLRELNVDFQGNNRIDRAKMSDIEDSLAKDSWISRAEISETIDGTVKINVWQRKPVLRIINDDSHNFYLDESGVILDPDISYNIDVPIVTGIVDFMGFRALEPLNCTKKSEPKEIFIEKLITFASMLREDDFLRSFVVQINLNGDGELELIPRVSNQIIRFGSLDDNLYDKLKSLQIFYSYGSSIADFERIKEVDIRYVGQIIVKL